MACDNDKVEAMVCGNWKLLRDENLEVCLKSMNYPEEAIQFILGTKPTLSMKRSGDTFDISFELVPGKKQSYSFKLGDDFIVKDDNDPPMYNNKEKITLEGDTVKIITKSQLTGPLKIDTEVHLCRKGNELHQILSALGDRSVVGTRVFVPDN
ncbi:hypothetical protein ACF0H5_016642 [Mactra antiquata]